MTESGERRGVCVVAGGPSLTGNSHSAAFTIGLFSLFFLIRDGIHIFMLLALSFSDMHSILPPINAAQPSMALLRFVLIMDRIDGNASIVEVVGRSHRRSTGEKESE